MQLFFFIGEGCRISIASHTKTPDEVMLNFDAC